ncbi:MAG: hypothetical protein WBK28_03790 [Minisyncoccia bacterium]
MSKSPPEGIGAEADRFARVQAEGMMELYDEQTGRGMRDPAFEGVPLKEFVKTYDFGTEVFDFITNTYQEKSALPVGWKLEDERDAILNSVIVYRAVPSQRSYLFEFPIPFPIDPEDEDNPVIMKVNERYVQSRKMQ